MSAEFEDGILPVGSFEGTVLETGLTYIFDNFSFNVDSALLMSKSASGRIGRQKAIELATSGSADCQLATATTPIPGVAMTFAVDADRDGSPEGYMVAKPERSYTSDGEYKAKLAVQRVVNPLIYASAGKTTAQIYAGLTDASAGAITGITFSAYVPPKVVLDASPWSATGLPTGLTISASTGAISGTPSAPGTYYPVIKCAGKLEFIRAGALVSETRVGSRSFKWIIT